LEKETSLRIWLLAVVRLVEGHLRNNSFVALDLCRKIRPGRKGATILAARRGLSTTIRCPKAFTSSPASQEPPKPYPQSRSS
jgi:hypothetical protein